MTCPTQTCFQEWQHASYHLLPPNCFRIFLLLKLPPIEQNPIDHGDGDGIISSSDYYYNLQPQPQKIIIVIYYYYSIQRFAIAQIRVVTSKLHTTSRVSNHHNHPVRSLVHRRIIIIFLLLGSLVSSYVQTPNCKMTSMLRSFARGGSRSSAFLGRVSNGSRQTTVTSSSAAAAPAAISRFMATQSGDEVKPPTALARLHLEDGSTLTGRSFGCHESVSGEVSLTRIYVAIVV